MTDYANPDALVTTEWLERAPRRHRCSRDRRGRGHDRLREGPYPRRLGWNWTTDLHTEVGRDYKDQDGFAALLADAGVGAETTVVLYGGNNNWFAAYAYWLLKLRGFDQIALLNGGRKKWELESRELTDEVPELRAVRAPLPGGGAAGDPRIARRGAHEGRR